MKILVINTGSSSIKYQLFNMDNHEAIASGIAEKIGEPQGRLKYNTAKDKIVKDEPIKDHAEGLNRIVELLTSANHGVIKDKNEIGAVGHRTVHGGEAFKSSGLINTDFINTMKKMIPLAPLHNPANITGIEVAIKIFPNAPQVGVFDTAFHQTMPDYAYRYAIPNELYEKNHVRRYGFHGTSHYYVAKEAAKHLGKKLEDVNLITIHLGNGASIAAVRGGKSIDTSMGMTPLEGLVMGTRSGDIDPAIPHFLATNNKMSIDEVNTLLNKNSGVKGIANNNDMRDVEDLYMEGKDKNAILACQMYAYRVKKYIGAYYAALGTVDALVFTAGVGENSEIIRGLACENMERLGITVDPEKNYPRGKGIREIHKNGGDVKVLIVPTNEELEIACQTLEVLNKK